MNKEEYNLLLETYTSYCVESMDMEVLMDFAYQGMLLRFEKISKIGMLEEIRDFAPHLLEEEA